MPPFSPTQTENWLRCPVLAHFKREGWEPRGLWTPNRLLGTAVGDALTAHYRRLRGDTDAPSHEDALAAAVDREYRDNATYTRDALVKLALKGARAALADRVGEQGQVLVVDEPLPSRARPDLVQRIPGQGLVVTDTKVSLSYGAGRIADYDTAHQLWHYAWEVGETLGEPVTWVRIHHVTLTPRATTLLHPIRVTPARLAFWLLGARDAWARMEAEREPVPNWTSCVTRYGACEFRDACHVLDRDPEAMAIVYERVPRG